MIGKRFERTKRSKFLSTPLTFPVKSSVSHNSAVAFIIRESENGELCVLLTKRASWLNSYANDVCLPGGMYDMLDNNLVNTALRESQEEIGINPGDLTFICTLPPFCTGLGAGKVYGIAVTPVVFWLNKNIELRVNTSEVDAAFWTPLSFFLSSAHRQSDNFTLVSGANVTLNMFTYFDPASQRKFVIYGCTANICVTASSIALNASPQFPFTGLALYHSPENDELVFAEVSTTTLPSLMQADEWKFTPFVMKYSKL